MKSIFKNWRTTLVGATIAASYTILNLAQNGSISAKDLLIAGGIAALGIISKDANVTGV